MRRLGLLVGLVFLGCQQLVPLPKQDNFVHVIRYEGETLSEVAAWYTGDVSNWSKIALANRGINPRRLVIGRTVIIPGSLLVRREPMPRGHLMRERGCVVPEPLGGDGVQVREFNAQPANSFDAAMQPGNATGATSEAGPDSSVGSKALTAPEAALPGDNLELVPDDEASDDTTDEDILRERERTLDELLPD